MTRHFYFSNVSDIEKELRRLERRHRWRRLLLVVAAVLTITLVWLLVGGKF